MCLSHPTVTQKQRENGKTCLFYDMNVFASFSVLRFALLSEPWTWNINQMLIAN